MYGHFSDILRLFKNRQKSDSFAAHLEQHFNSTTSHIDQHTYMMFKEVNKINPIGTMKTFTRPNCNLCMEKHLTIIKNLCDKHITMMNNHSDIYGSLQHKTTFH